MSEPSDQPKFKIKRGYDRLLRYERACKNHPDKPVKVSPIAYYGDHIGERLGRSDQDNKFEPISWKICRECWKNATPRVRSFTPCYYCGTDARWESDISIYCCYDCL